MCYEVNNNGKTLKEALDSATKHLPTMNKYFTIPTTLNAGAAAAKRPRIAEHTGTTRRPPDGLQAEVQPPPAPHAGKGRGKGNKGRGRGDQRTGWKSGGSGRTPDGRLKCFRYQRKKCQGNCGKVHTCLLCNGPHPMVECDRRPARTGDAAGTQAGRGQAR